MGDHGCTPVIKHGKITSTFIDDLQFDYLHLTEKIIKHRSEKIKHLHL